MTGKKGGTSNGVQLFNESKPTGSSHIDISKINYSEFIETPDILSTLKAFWHGSFVLPHVIRSQDLGKCKMINQSNLQGEQIFGQV